MSLPQRIYELGRDVANCQLVTSRTATPDNMTEFQNLLNQSWPVDANEEAQRNLVRGMYYGNPTGFLEYIGAPRNRVRSLILWTESKRIAKFFNLNGCVHISWDEATHSYNVVPHVTQPRREQQVEPVDEQKESERPKRAPRNLRHERKNMNANTENEPAPVRGVKSKRNLVGMAHKQAKLAKKRNSPQRVPSLQLDKVQDLPELTSDPQTI